MPPIHPTAREIVLLTVLFASLLFFSATFPRNSGSVTDILKTLPYVVEEELETTPLTLETQYTLQALNSPLSWGAGQVPETKIVAHVPGESSGSVLCLHAILSTSICLATRPSHRASSAGACPEVRVTLFRTTDGQRDVCLIVMRVASAYCAAQQPGPGSL